MEKDGSKPSGTTADTVGTYAGWWYQSHPFSLVSRGLVGTTVKNAVAPWFQPLSEATERVLILLTSCSPDTDADAGTRLPLPHDSAGRSIAETSSLSGRALSPSGSDLRPRVPFPEVQRKTLFCLEVSALD